MKTIQEKLCDRVYELLPEKKELEFGCEIEALIGDDIMWADFEIGKVMYECGMCTKHKRQSSCSEDCDMKDAIGVLFGSEDNGYSIVTIEKSATYKIIGQPLRLADVLICIEEKKYPNNLLRFEKDNLIDRTMLEVVQSYNLSKDNLLDQSNDFCEFVYNLIK